jgi:hypothetical protein
MTTVQDITEIYRDSKQSVLLNIIALEKDSMKKSLGFASIHDLATTTLDYIHTLQVISVSYSSDTMIIINAVDYDNTNIAHIAAVRLYTDQVSKLDYANIVYSNGEHDFSVWDDEHVKAFRDRITNQTLYYDERERAPFDTFLEGME